MSVGGGGVSKRVFSRRNGKGVVLSESLWVSNEAVVKVVSTGYGRIFESQIESFRKTVRRRVKRGKGKVVIIIEPKLSYTRKPLQARMGSGKGKVVEKFCFVRPGQTLAVLVGFSFFEGYRVVDQPLVKLGVSAILVI